MNQNYPFHYICMPSCAINLDAIKYLMGSSAPGLSAANNDNKLPFHLLIEYENEQVRESPEFNGIS